MLIFSIQKKQPNIGERTNRMRLREGKIKITGVIYNGNFNKIQTDKTTKKKKEKIVHQI